MGSYPPFIDASTPKRTEALTILKLKKAFDEEVSKRRIVEKQLHNIQKRLANASTSTEDSIRLAIKFIITANNIET